MMAIIHLYRKDGAIGAASHWARNGGRREGFEYLGLGRLVPAGRNKITGQTWQEHISAPGIALCKDMQNLAP